MAQWYGVLSGFAFSASFATFGIFGGVVADNFNRLRVSVLSCILWSACTSLSGLIDSFAGLFILRFLLGFFESVFNPCAYSIISDYFHPDYRTLANSLFNSGVYFGAALASVSSLIIGESGWRAAFEIVGAIGIASAVLTIITVREPQRGYFD